MSMTSEEVALKLLEMTQKVPSDSAKDEIIERYLKIINKLNNNIT